MPTQVSVAILRPQVRGTFPIFWDSWHVLRNRGQRPEAQSTIGGEAMLTRMVDSLILAGCSLAFDLAVFVLKLARRRGKPA